MSLRDTACYTLTLDPSPSDPDMVQLLEPAAPPSGAPQPRYVRIREHRNGEVYSGVIYDAFSGAKLGSMGYSSAKDKKRRLDLHGPDESISFEHTGKINFEWTFIFEGNTYKWTRELYGKDYICSLDRKPDPKVEICLARDADKNNPGRLQILHYNIERFTSDIRDLRGLETLLVASLMMIIDAADERSARPTPPKQTSSSSLKSNGSDSVPPPIPKKPVKIITEEDYEPENPNEIIVGMHTNIDEHVARSIGLLEDPSVLFVVVRTRNASATQRALEVSLGVKRFRHREGLDDLKQYVIEEEPFKTSSPASSASSSRPGPPVIKLDDPLPTHSGNPGSRPAGWQAPNIAIYLSKIDLPDLKPGRREMLKPPSSDVGGRRGSSSGTGPPPKVPPHPSSAPNQLLRPNNQPAPPPRPSSPSTAATLAAAPAGSAPVNAKPSTGGSGGGGLTRLFKSAASKI